MADPHASESSSGHKEEFKLKIISPSPEIGPLHFPAISTSCTVAQLKQKISDASETKIPLPSQQRLIYRGHVLAQEQRTLKDVFGQETIDHSSEPLTVHLAFNPGAHHGHASSSSTSHHRAHHDPPPQPTIVNAAPDAPTVPTGITNDEGAAPQQQPPFVQPLQAQIPQPNALPHMQQAIAIMNQQIAAQMASLGLPPPAPLQNAAPAQYQGQLLQTLQNPQLQPHPHPQMPQFQTQPLHQLPSHQAVYHQHQNHQSHNHFGQHPAPVTQPGPQPQVNPHMTPRQALQQHMAQQSALRHQHQAGTAASNQGMETPRSNSAPPPGLGNPNTVIRASRQTIGPNGETHQSIVASGTFQLNRGFQLPAGLRQRGTSGPDAPTPGTSTPGTPSVNAQIPDQQPNPQGQFQTNPSTTNLRIQLIQSQMLSMELAMNLRTIPPESAYEQIRTLLRSIATSINHQQYQQLETRRGMLLARATAMRNHENESMNRFAEQVANQENGRSSEESAVYMLSSPSGPTALLISPTGNYAAPWPIPLAPQAPPMGLPNPPFVNVLQNGLNRPQHGQINAIQLAQPQPDGQPQMVDGVQVLPNPQQLQPHPAVPGQNLAQQNGQAPNQARDIVRILLPLGGHLWLIIRLFGFVYFFTHGASWQRTILLTFLATALFIAQTGLFQPVLQSLWDPIRRHAEALLPLAGNEPPRRANAPVANNGNAEGVQRRNQEPTPEQAAERLLREREAQDGNFLRQSLRRMERAVALFVASLVPGVGERHIAAREAAEAARQQQEMEREEQVRREEEEQVKREAEERERTEKGEEPQSVDQSAESSSSVIRRRADERGDRGEESVR